MIDGYKTISEISNEWGISPRRIQVLCNEGRIDGVTKFGRTWAIPVGAEKPKDERIISGRYKNWRTKKGE